ncbi:MAG: hypothetical protein K8R25_00930 [Methanosarcinales archaeon]|nr:hypothetical protein [Methanosarcinales archaeon]
MINIPEEWWIRRFVESSSEASKKLKIGKCEWSEYFRYIKLYLIYYEKKWIYFICPIISILFLIIFSIPSNAAVGDLILDTKILFPYDDPHETTTLSTTLLKEGYSLSLDDVYSDHTVAGFTIYKDEKIVKRIKVNEGDYFHYNKTIGGREYTIIESKVIIFLGIGSNLVKLEPFYQYSDGSTIIEPDFVSTILNPKITETPSEEWNRTFGRIYDDSVSSFQQTSDDGYILGGTIMSRNTGGILYNSWLIKVDVNGIEQWDKTFEDFMFIPSVSHFHDGGYIFVGIKSTERMSTMLLKTDVNGNQQWKKSFFDLEDAHSIQQTSDGGYILAAKSDELRGTDGGYIAAKSYGPRCTDARLVKTDQNGSEQWSKTFGLDGCDKASSVWETQDGGYMLGGDTLWLDNRRLDAWLLKTDANGNEQWNRTFGGAGDDYVYSVRNTLDGGYILAGRTGSYGAGIDAWLIKTDANGNEQWNKTFGLDGSDWAYSVMPTSDGGYVLGGKLDTAKNPDFKDQILYEDNDVWLFKTDANGNLEWSKTIGGLKSDVARFVQQTSDGGYVIAGTTESYGSGGSDIWLVKVAGMKVNTTQSQVITSDNNVTDNNITDNIQTSPGKSIPGFGFLGAVFSILIILLSRRRILLSPTS